MLSKHCSELVFAILQLSDSEPKSAAGPGRGMSMTSTKRLGTQKSATRAALIDAAEQLIREEGYAALTTRRLAETSGIKFQLIYYYFNTLEDLLLEVVARHSQRNIERLEQALNSERPLRGLWEHHTDPVSGVTSELVVLAKQYERVRAAIAANAEVLREMEVRVMSRYFESRGVDIGMSALDLAMLLTSVSRTLRMERSFGMSVGHANLEAMVEAWFGRIENAPPGRIRKPKS
jgi:TetR/AcrR family transcriptional regulator